MNRNRLPGYNELNGDQRRLLARLQVAFDDQQITTIWATATPADQAALARYFVSGQPRTDDFEGGAPCSDHPDTSS